MQVGHGFKLSKNEKKKEIKKRLIFEILFSLALPLKPRNI